jgi:hypothetical protein
MNTYILFVAALIPLMVGMVWYNQKVFGNIWLKEIGKTAEEVEAAKPNMLKIFGFTYLFSLMAASVYMSLVIHQQGAYSLIEGDVENALPSFHAFIEDYGTLFRTFKHGMLHGTIGGLFLSLPMVGVHSLFENRSWKYIFIHVGYWTVSSALMGGVICQFL